MNRKEQLLRWQNGESVHDKETDLCCPDGSCCHPELEADQYLKDLLVTAFLDGNPSIWEPILETFALAVTLKEIETKGGEIEFSIPPEYIN